MCTWCGSNKLNIVHNMVCIIGFLKVKPTRSLWVAWRQEQRYQPRRPHHDHQSLDRCQSQCCRESTNCRQATIKATTTHTLTLWFPLYWCLWWMSFCRRWLHRLRTHGRWRSRHRGRRRRRSYQWRPAAPCWSNHNKQAERIIPGYKTLFIRLLQTWQYICTKALWCIRTCK